VWLASKNIMQWMERFIARIVAVSARKFYLVRTSILYRLSWMTNKAKLLWMTTGLIFVLGCGLFSHTYTPIPDLFATLQASTPSTFSSPEATQLIPTPDFSFPTATAATAQSVPVSSQTSIPAPSAADQLSGHIVFTCQIYKVQSANQVCIMNA